MKRFRYSMSAPTAKKDISARYLMLLLQKPLEQGPQGPGREDPTVQAGVQEALVVAAYH
eukprot:CAMPEP_0184737254 /NCGR_PEP_ID=MMETSP0315-20130426/26_1 /TAXON_ID=101924 /ORGANISM="Rhodosorus marinus, Strain UTEX LB 2760" /LENGTH=58 /DNA_ID=CAMNT_0027204333 /DNA_START=91 /DNA_END=264 /DNA_ORIENTATION=-